VALRLSSLEDRLSFALLGPGFRGATGAGTELWLDLREVDGAAPSTSSPELVYAPFETAGGRARRFTAIERTRIEPLTRDHLDVEPAQLDVMLDDRGHAEAIAAIRTSIAAGDVYQVCHTVRAHLGECGGAALFAALAGHGLARFAAWVRLPGGEELVSASPELMFEVRGPCVRAEPMKGTSHPADGAALASSEKDAAELAMITDLVRNDLTSVCAPRSVHVTCERRVLDLGYALQNVSDVEGELADGVTDLDVLAALHPGGSVTGAPKIAALRHIHALEATPRGAYCGALGVREDGDATYAILIRTASRSSRTAPWVYGVGGGIVWDSDPALERRELDVKLGALGAHAIRGSRRS
jgi:para-aminobenzoate synthetase/4-amino-4-deoxychorismate lyase